MNNNTTNGKRGGYVSERQKKKLRELMQFNEELRKCKFSSTFTFKDAQKKWEEISENLNSIPGAKNDWKQWRTTWQDIKQSTKKKSCEIKKSFARTGGGPADSISLSQDDEDVLAMINKTTVDGDMQVAESIVEFDVNETITMNEGVAEQPQIVVVDVKLPAVDNELPSSDDIQQEAPPILPSTSSATKKTIKRKKSSAAKRLQDSVEASKHLANICNKKMEAKKEYWVQKIAILERIARSKERRARASKRKARATERITAALAILASRR